jgi:hypothetical protein
MVEVARVEIQVISVHRHGGIFELDADLHAFTFRTRRKVQQGMFVEPQLGEDAVEA